MAENNEEEATGLETSLGAEAQQVLELVGSLSILELNRLVKVMEKKFGVSPVAPLVARQAASVDDQSDDKAPAEGKSNYDVVLQEVGGGKIAVIRAVRAVNQSLGLKEAKELVEGAPKTVVENLPAEEAEKAKAALEEAGAIVELK